MQKDINNKIETAVLPFKIQQLVEIIMDKKRISLQDALHYLYSSHLYQLLCDESAKLWYLSGPNLYEELEKEKRAIRDKESRESKITLFQIFCIENYKNSKSLTGEEVLCTFSQYNVYEFLSKHYEALHSQSKEYILTEIKQFIKNKKNK